MSRKVRSESECSTNPAAGQIDLFEAGAYKFSIEYMLPSKLSWSMFLYIYVERGCSAVYAHALADFRMEHKKRSMRFSYRCLGY